MKRCFILFFCIAVFLGFYTVQCIYAGDKGKAQSLDKVFQEQGLGYSIQYPGHWVITKHSDHVVVFSKGKKKEVQVPTIGIENVYSVKREGGKYNNTDEVIADLESKYKHKSFKDVKVYAPEQFLYAKNGVNLTGKQFTTEFTRHGRKFRQWIIVLPRANGELFHIWVYTATAKMYDAYSGTAKAMLDSWVILP